MILEGNTNSGAANRPGDACLQVRDQLERVMHGRLDSLDERSVEQLELHVAACAGCAAQLGAASVDASVASLAVPSAAPLPSAGEWAAVWSAIERECGGAGTERGQPYAGRRTFLRIAAVAASCVLLVGLWRVQTRGPGAGQRAQLAQHVQVESIETFGDAAPFIALNDDGGVAMIWVMSDDEGA